MTSSMMNFPTSRGGRSSMAAAAAAYVKVRRAGRRYGLMNRRTRSRDCTAEYSVSFEALHSVQGDRSWLNDFGVFCPPVLLELFQLGERGEIGHSIEKELALQVVNLVLNADGIEARGVQLNGLAITIEACHSHPDRTSYLAAEPIDAETSLPALGSHRRVAQYLRVDQDGPREAVLPLALHDHDLLPTAHLQRRQADTLSLDQSREPVVNELLETALADFLQGNRTGDLPQHRRAKLRNLEDRHRSTP